MRENKIKSICYIHFEVFALFSSLLYPSVSGIFAVLLHTAPALKLHTAPTLGGREFLFYSHVVVVIIGLDNSDLSLWLLWAGLMGSWFYLSFNF